MIWPTFAGAVLIAWIPAAFASHLPQPPVHGAVQRRALTTSASGQRVAFGLKTEGTTVTASGINIGFHIDWDAGEVPQTLNSRLGQAAAVVGGYIHLNTTNQTYFEMDEQLPSISKLASTSVYSPAVIPQFSLSLWTTAMTTTLANRMASLNAAGITVWLRFAYEMNGLWMDYGQDPTDYITVWQEVVTAIRAVAPTTYFLWAPNIYPGATGINGYSDYYPGAGYVDMAGLSFYCLGDNQVDNDLPDGDYFSSNVQSFYDLYSPAHPIVIAETSAPEHYLVPTQYADLAEDSEIPGGADTLDFSTLTIASGTSTSELSQKSVWFEEMTNATAAEAYPQLLAVLWFNLAKIGGYDGVLRLNDYRAVKTANDTVTAWFRSEIGNETAYQLSLLPAASTTVSSALSTVASAAGVSATAIARTSSSSSASRGVSWVTVGVAALVTGVAGWSL